MNDDTSSMGSGTVLPEVESLPLSEGEASVADGNALGCSRDGTSRMCGHVVFPFEAMLPTLRLWGQTLHPPFEVSEYRGIGVLLNQQTGGSVLYEHRAKAHGDSRGVNDSLNALGDVVKGLGLGWND